MTNSNNKSFISKLWIVKFFRELFSWFVVRKTYLKNKKRFDDFKIRSNWFGKLYLVINRNPDIKLGSDEDKVYLQNETARLQNFFLEMGIYGNLAFDMNSFENVTKISDSEEEFEQGYLFTFTPAYDPREPQHVTFWTVLFVFGTIFVFIIWLISIISSLI